MNADIILFSASAVSEEIDKQFRDLHCPAMLSSSKRQPLILQLAKPAQHEKKNETHLVFVAWAWRSQAVWRVGIPDRHTHAHIPTCLIDSSLCSHLCARLTTSSTPAPAYSIHQPRRLLLMLAAVILAFL